MVPAAALAAASLLACVVLAACSSSSERRFAGAVVGVTDGDTISVMRDGRAATVRLAGIDCPERGQPFGSQAKQFTSSLVFGRRVTVDVQDTDRYGRLVGRLYEGRTDVSLELVRAGMAWHYRQYSNDASLREAEQEARTARRGLWADAHPTAPWEFRVAEREGGEEVSPAGRNEQISPAERHLALGSDVGQRVEQTLGLSPALAASPFFGLALLTGAALVVDSPWARESGSPVVQALRSNTLLVRARKYSSWWLFGALASLALLGFLLNTGKIQGLMGKPLRLVESVGTLAIMAYLMAASGQGALAEVHVPAASVAGLLPPLGMASLITAGLILVFAAMMLVRMALDVLIWVSPIPFIDLLFEVIKHAFSAGFLVLFVVSPWMAALVAVLILMVSLFLFRWAARWLGFGVRVPLNPFLSRLLPGLRPTLSSDPWRRKLGVSAADSDIAVPASVWKSRGHRKRQPGVIVTTNGIPQFRTTAFPGRVWSTDVRPPGCHLEVGRALLWLEVRAVDENRHAVERFALSYALLPASEDLCRHLGAVDSGCFGPLNLIAKVMEKHGHAPVTA